MQANTDLASRLRAEADAQNARMLRTKPESRGKFYFLLEKTFRKYNDALGELSGRRVLVAGCSDTGVLTMARHGAIVTGIDIADEAVRILNARIETEGMSARANAMVMNAEDPDFPPESFDIIACTGVLHHLDIERAAASWARLLRPTGRLVMMEPMAWSPAASIYRVFTPSMHTADEHPLKPADFRTLQKHFGQIDVESFAFTSTLAVVWAVIPDVFKLKLPLRNGLDWLDRRLMRLFPFLKYFAWSSVIECSRPKQTPQQGQA